MTAHSSETVQSSRVRSTQLLPGGLFIWLCCSFGFVVLAFILLPLYEMISQPSLEILMETAADSEVMGSIFLSIWTSMSASLVVFILGTPLAWLMARTQFPGKKIVESVIDLPIMLPHPVIGIALLSLAGRGHWFGEMLGSLGLSVMGSPTGIMMVMGFVGLPFYINAAKSGFESVPQRLENVARSLGASRASTFFRVTIPLCWRHMLAGFIMSTARAISEFGAIVIIAYHPRVAPVLMYERFTSYGLKYSQPVAVWLIAICLVLFVLLRALTLPRRDAE
ncbi:ABC transporter permease [Desulfobaculum bizertense]|uniref:Tungstate/molybdate transport system permease protein n=1 Tax=Desulfobaculum bizertense DSM 18034 TaxID=1121442 RepID=A0A1T4WNT7_9BACT|nr:ABC transporter permease [Desulfobaculum bizertense]UIJ39326.1 ABC transporter permease [Desulfobaculum bizertense]SKA78889.1 tungstate/molybdate transport system permease protein [Desulfobaculum bizertense DSM 18034]